MIRPHSLTARIANRFARLALMCIALSLPACGGGGEEAGEGDAGADAPGLRFLSIVSGGQQGIYYPTAIQFSNIINNSVDGVKVSVETSGGSVANARLLANKDADFATMQNDIAFYADRGEGMFDATIDNLRGVVSLYPEVCQIVARAGSGIKSVSDLRGRKVSIGAPGSGTEMNARQILQVYGLDPDDLSLVERLKNTEASDKLKDGHIEAAFLTYGLGAPVITDMSVTTDIVLVPVSPEKAAELVARYPFYKASVIPAGTYKGVDADVPTVSVMAWFFARAGLDDEFIYQSTKALFDNLETLHGPTSPARLKAMSLDTALDGLSVKLHPGALRYYEERGIAP